jgi:hypothetical protein
MLQARAMRARAAATAAESEIKKTVERDRKAIP